MLTAGLIILALLVLLALVCTFAQICGGGAAAVLHLCAGTVGTLVELLSEILYALFSGD
jgi:hypothetical protein